MGPLVLMLVASFAIYFVGKKSTSCGVTLGLVLILVFIVWAVFNTTVEIG